MEENYIREKELLNQPKAIPFEEISILVVKRSN